MRGYFWKQILDWYENNKRNFPWRKTDNAYYLLIAEVLLQQTNVRKVTPIYDEIIREYYNPSILAEADVESLKNIIKPLGLLYRAERLIDIAGIIKKEYNCRVPCRRNELLNLPGVGNYIADAVLCYGFGKKTVPIDTNVIRLFSRYFSLKSEYSRARNDKVLLTKIKGFYDFKDYKEPNLAVLDFSSMVCSSRNPKCSKCCLNKKCSYFNYEGDSFD
jgi:A/G-specific adenine glycosylase